MIYTFNNFEQFKKKATTQGVSVDLSELLSVDVTFLESYEDYVLISVKDYSGVSGEKAEKSNGVLVLSDNILVLSDKDSLLYSENKSFSEKDYKMYRYSLQKPEGESTVLAFLTLREILSNYQNAFKAIDEKIDELEKRYDLEEAEKTTIRLRRLTNRIEDFVSLLVDLEERKIRQVNTSLVGYDYKLVLTRSQNILDRCRNHLSQLRDIQKQEETRQSFETNKQIRELSGMMKKLAGAMVILLVIAVLAIEFFFTSKFVEELNSTSAFTGLVAVQVALALVLLVYFRQKKWL